MDTQKIELSSVITDIAAGPFGSNLKVSCFVEDGFPIIDGANLKGYKVTDNVTKFVTEEKANSLYRAIAHRGDIVVTISGTLGQIAYIPDDSAYEAYLVSQRQFRVTFDSNRVCIPYLIFYFHTYEGQHKILSFANQVGVPALSQPLKNFRKIEIELPDLSTQTRIASIVQAINNKIELNARINHNLEQQAQAIFKSWFDTLEPTQPFTNAVRVLGGGTPKTGNEDYWNGTIPFFTPKDTGELYILTTEKNLTEAGLSNCNSRHYPVNTVFVTARGTVGKLALAGCPMAMNQSCYALMSNGDYGQLYVYHLAVATVEKLKRKANGAVFDAIVTRDFETELVPSPSITDIRDFEENVTPLYNSILNNCNENRRLVALRDTLLPKLMSGELDVSAVDI